MRMKSTFTGLVAVVCLVLVLAISGCVCCNFGAPEVVVPTEEPEPTGIPTLSPTEEPDTYTPMPGTTTAEPTLSPITVTPTPVAGVMDAEMTGYGTDKDTYNRGDTATCYVDIENTGEVPIDRVDFIVNVYTPRPFIGLYHAINNQTYSVDQQNIQPGETKRVEISVVIPASYQGISTAGDYTFDIVVRIGNKDIGSFSKNIKVV